jgi:hypothetical protein
MVFPQDAQLPRERMQAMADAQLVVGQTINLQQVDRLLLLLDDLPGVVATASFAEGAQTGSTDVRIALGQGKAYGINLTADNAGSVSTGADRISASVWLHNAGGWGDALQLQAVATEGSRYGRVAYTLPVGLQGVRAGLHASDMRYHLVGSFAALQASGYNGEKVVIINPTDFPLIGPHGQVTADRLRRIGMNVELAETDWGTVVQRRVRTEPADRGGWSIFHTYGSSLAYLNPAVSALVKGPGATGWFGWYGNPRAQELVDAWLDAPDAERQLSLANELNRLAQDDVATVPLGQFTMRTAWRRNITGHQKGSMPYPWGVRPA